MLSLPNASGQEINREKNGENFSIPSQKQNISAPNLNSSKKVMEYPLLTYQELLLKEYFQ